MESNIQNSLPAVEWKQTATGKINYNLVGENGEILYACNQGFERRAGMIKNLEAIARAFNGTVTLPVNKVKTFSKVKRKKK